MSEKDFFKVLAEKTRKEPSPEFDRGFWARFNAEFGSQEKASLWSSFWTGLSAIRLAGALTALMVVTTATVFYARQSRLSNPLQEAGKSGMDVALLSSWKEVDAIAADLTLFQTLDDVAMSDSDWEILLAEEGKDGARS